MKKQITFEKQESFSPRNEKEEFLVKAFLSLKTSNEMASFLRDLLTTAEIEEFSNRLEITKQLIEGKPYLEIAKNISTSTTTVSRVAHWLFAGCGGYATALTRLLKLKK